MKNGKSLVLLTALAIVALAGAASAQNILTNPDFETGDLTGWEVNGVSGSSNVSVLSGDNGPSLPGQNYAFLDNQAEAIGLNLKQVTPPGSAGAGTVTWQFDLRLDQADVGGVFFAEIFAEQEGVGIIGGSGLQGPFFPAFGVWETFSGSFTSPAGTDFLVIQFVATTGANVDSSCIARLDNVILTAEGAVAAEASTFSGVKALYR
jgi:hypothetical protein